MIGFAGLSHLGLVSAVAAASKGFDVAGYDPDPRLLASLERGELPVVEPGLPGLFAAARARIAFSSAPAVLGGCDLVYIAADVPIDDEGRSDLSPVAGLLDVATAATSPGATLVILSQVPPGYTRAHLAAATGRGLLYQVETLVFGRAVERALRPERFIVGCVDPATPLPGPLDQFLRAFDCPILPMRLESAELTKIAINMFLTAAVTTTNMLAEASEAVGGDWTEIASALKLDKRIGPHAYVKPGLGIGGTNLLRDMLSVKAIASEWGTDARQVDAWLANSRWRRGWALRAVHREVLAARPEATLAVWGLAYKENTSSTRHSPGVELVDALTGCTRRVFDPVAALDRPGDPAVVRCATAIDACRGADALLIMTPWPEFVAVAPMDLAAAMTGRIVIDPFGVLAADRCAAAGLRQLTLGVARLARTVAAC